MNSRRMLGTGITCMMAIGIAIALGLWVSPAVAGKKALTDADMDGVAAGGQSTIIESGDGSPVNFTDDSQFNLNFDVTNAQTGFRALTIQNVVGELQLLVNLNVLSANGNVAGTDQRNYSLQSWGGTLPIPGTGIIGTVSGVAAAPCTATGSCVSTGGSANAPNTVTATAGNAAAAEGGAGGAGASSASVTANAGNGATGASSAGATGGNGASGASGGSGGSGGSSGNATGGEANASSCSATNTCTATSGAVQSGIAGSGGGGGGGGAGGAGGAAQTGNGGNGGNGGNATATSGAGGAGGNGGNASAASGGNAAVNANAGRAGSSGALTVSGSASTSPGVVAISPTASASGDLIIRAGSGSTVNALDNSQFNLTFTEPNAQSDLAALFISNVVGRSQMALNLNIASSRFTTVPFEAGSITGDITGTIKQVNTGIQFRGTPLVGATGVTSSLNMTINHQNQ